MASLFGYGDTDSDEERAEKSRQTWQQIQSDNTANKVLAASPKDQQDDVGPIDALNEEQELKSLRNSEAYKRYTENTEKRSKVLVPSEQEKEAGDRKESEKEEENSENLEISHEPTNPLVKDNYSNLSAEPRTSKTSSKLSTIKVRSTKIDPKIIDDSSDESESDDEESDPGPSLPAATETYVSVLNKIPIHEETTLSSRHDAYVSCIGLDKSGNRFFSGSVDSSVMLWDFNSMTRSLRSFKSITPFDESAVKSVQFSPTGGMVACCGAATSALIMDRDGEVLSQTAKGDMYIVDMARTKGHVGHVNAVLWKPDSTSSAPVILTASLDSTIRLWDVSRAKRIPMNHIPIIPQMQVTKLRNPRGSKMIATALDWHSDGKRCVLGCSDGTVKIINPESTIFRALNTSNPFIDPGVDITSVTCASSNSSAPMILVRSADDSLRVFDERNLTLPVKHFDQLPNALAETNVSFIDDDCNYFITGTSANRRDKSSRGSLRVYSRQLLREVWKRDVEQDAGSVTHVTWHKKINQVLYGTADGSVRTLYHSEESNKGILSCLSKSERRKAYSSAPVEVSEIYTGSELHQIGKATRKRRNEDLSQNIDIGIKKGRQNSYGRVTQKDVQLPRTKLDKKSLAKHLAAKEIKSDWNQDPRAAILRYAEVAKTDPQFTKAYQETQPETLLTEKTVEEEEDENKRQIYDRDRLRNIRKS